MVNCSVPLLKILLKERVLCNIITEDLPENGLGNIKKPYPPLIGICWDFFYFPALFFVWNSTYVMALSVHKPTAFGFL